MLNAVVALVRALAVRVLGVAVVPALLPGFLAALASPIAAVAGFLSTPAGKWVGVALIAGALYLAGDVRRAVLDHERYEARWAAAVAQADEARAARDADIAGRVQAEAERRIAAIARQSDQLQSKVAEYEQALSHAHETACRATADDARRLRGLSAPDAAQGRGVAGVRDDSARGRAAPRQGW
jgi:hypothetical protein